MEHLVDYIIKKINRASTMTEFLKSIQYNDRYGCVTVPNQNGSINDECERIYPPLVNGRKVSVFLKEMYKSIKAER